MHGGLDGKGCVVTGSAGGIGGAVGPFVTGTVLTMDGGWTVR